MQSNRTYSLRQEILKYAKNVFPAPFELNDLMNHPGFVVYRPTREEALEQVNGLLANGYLRTIEDSNGQYMTISTNGLNQINQEGDLDSFIFGKAGLKVLCIILALCLLFLSSGCSLANKSWAMANSIDAFKITTAVDPQTGTPLPQVLAGGGTNCMSFQVAHPKEQQTQTVMSYSKRDSFWSIFSSDTGSGNVSFTYIAGSDETPEQTQKILKEVSEVIGNQQCDDETKKALEDLLSQADKNFSESQIQTIKELIETYQKQKAAENSDVKEAVDEITSETSAEDK